MLKSYRSDLLYVKFKHGSDGSLSEGGELGHLIPRDTQSQQAGEGGQSIHHFLRGELVIGEVKALERGKGGLTKADDTVREYMRFRGCPSG